MKTISNAAILILIAFQVAACSPAPAELTATLEQTAAETKIAAPTQTRALSSKPTGTPTADASGVSADGEVFETDVLTAGYGLDGGELIWNYEHDPLELEGKPGDIPFIPLQDPSNFSDFILGFDVEWSLNPDTGEPGENGCGVVFRTVDSSEFLVFVAQKDSLTYSWNLEHWGPDGFVGSLVGDAYFYADGVIDQDELLNPDKNHLVLVADGNNATAFANGELLGAAPLPANLSEGRILVFPRVASGTTTCTFSNVWVWEIKN